MAWGVLIYVIAVSGFWFASNNVIRSTFEQQAMEWMERVRQVGRPWFVNADESTRAAVDSYLKTYDEISYVRFYRADTEGLGEEFLHRGIDTDNLPALDAEAVSNFWGGKLKYGKPRLSYIDDEENLLRIIAPVSTDTAAIDDLLQTNVDLSLRTKAQVVGYLDMGVNLTSYKRRLTENVVAGSVLISFFFMLAAVVGRELITNALKPLLDLQEPLKRLANGETDVWVSGRGDEEIAAISRALNSTISAIKGRDRELRRLADYDALTGLINKRSFSQLLEQEHLRAIEENDSSALLFIDLDQFKFINDTLGHAAGDRLLVQVANLLISRLRSDDVVCRLGGDEFAVLAKSVDKAGAVEIANVLVKAMYDFLFMEQGKSFNIYCSIGVALMQNDGSAAEDVFCHADLACHAAKSQGRNRYMFYESQTADVSKIDIGWSHRIAHALTHDGFVLHYQPIVNLERQTTPCFEVLLRMKGENDEVIYPNIFISVAERFGLATEIDYWVIKSSMRTLEQLNQQGQRVRFYVNLSGQLLADPEFVPRVLAILDGMNVDPQQIVFELTERAAVGNIHNASVKMQTLRQHGFLFAVDDFGSGFSSFSYLKHMPVEYVKIEGEFVERMMEDEVDRALVKSMVDVAKACGKKVVAEFVGNQETLDLVRSFGIDYAQGFFIAMPEAELSFNYFDEAPGAARNKMP